MTQQLHHRPYQKMSASQSDTTTIGRHNMSVKVILSYVLDWTVLIVVGIVSYIIGDLEPHKRPFSLTDPDISYVDPHSGYPFLLSKVTD